MKLGVPINVFLSFFFFLSASLYRFTMRYSTGGNLLKENIVADKISKLVVAYGHFDGHSADLIKPHQLKISN